MKRTMKLGMLAVVLLAATAGRTQAGSQSFDFSFTTDATTPLDWITGTVTGEIMLPSGDGIGLAATLVSIVNIPSGMTSIYNPPLPINATAWDRQMRNSFTVSGGMITSADYSANDVLSTSEGSLIVFGSGSNQLQFTNQNVVQNTGNESGPLGVTFTPVSVPIPEPSSLILAGMAGICGFAWRVAAKHRKARNHQNGA